MTDVAEIARGLTKAQREALPKAGWRFNYLEPGPRSPLFMRTRGANFAAIWLWRFHFAWPMPWLDRPARQLHPEVFTQEQPR